MSEGQGRAGRVEAGKRDLPRAQGQGPAPAKTRVKVGPRPQKESALRQGFR